jgi:hypothetical protein
MSKKNRLSRDQKRKAKLAKQVQKARARMPPSPLAYAGNKYKKDEYLPLVAEAEMAVHEVDVVSGKQLRDRHVKAALEQLVLQMREGRLEPLGDTSLRLQEGGEAEALAVNIRRHWEAMSEEAGTFSKDEQIGVLRTLINSVETWTSPNPESRGYLSFVEGFLKQEGLSAKLVPTDEFDEEGAEEEDEMLEVGRDWAFDGDVRAEDEFRKMVAERIRSGDAESVVEVCQQLIGELGGQYPKAQKELSLLSFKAQDAMGGRP